MKAIVFAFIIIALGSCAFGQNLNGNGTLPKRPMGVPMDAHYFNGKWYKIVPDKLPWNSAKQNAERMGGQLAVVPDELTWVFIKQMVGGAAIWIGASDEANEGQWKWVDGTPVTFSAWGSGQPDNASGNEHFMMVWKNSMNDLQRSGSYIGNQKVAGYVVEWRQK